LKAGLASARLNVAEGRLRWRNTSMVRRWLRKAMAAGDAALAGELRRELERREARYQADRAWGFA
jgi:hypothetical protein